jgi:iron complex transport system ATP-binding protein
METKLADNPSPLLIEYRNLTVSRGGRLVLDHLNLSIASNENVAILGPNGAGKSSLIKTISREYYPLADQDSFIRIFGRDSWDIFELRSHLGIVSNQVNGNSANLTCREMVLSGFFGSSGIAPYETITPDMENKASQVMRFLGIAGLAFREVGQLSTGEYRLTLIGRALVPEPPTMLLDEPTLSLDPRAAWSLRRKLSQMAGLGKNIIIVTHDLADIIPEIQRIILIRDGKVVADGKKSNVLKSKTISNLFGIDLQVFSRDGYYYLR